MKTNLSYATLGMVALLMASAAPAAEKLGAKATLTCDFPAAEAPQKIKPGKTGVSDGVIRITASKLTLKVCDGCVWDDKQTKWQVTPTQYLLATKGGIAITVSRADGAAVFKLSSTEDEYYQPAQVESRGQCKAADQAAAKP